LKTRDILESYFACLYVLSELGLFGQRVHLNPYPFLIGSYSKQERTVHYE